MAVSDIPTTIYIIDDDEAVRRALARVFRSVGFESQQFPSTHEFMRAEIESNCACAVADLNIAGDEPTELPRRLEAENIDLPVIYVTADDSERNRAWVQSVGGCGLFRKPVDDQALIDAIRWAIEQHKPTH